MKPTFWAIALGLVAASLPVRADWQEAPWITQPPAGCVNVVGVYPLGPRTQKIWAYEDYAVVLPPYKKKKALSWQCGSQRGTLYYFDYASEAQKERALLFVRPLIAQEAKRADAVREWKTGFVILSFATMPKEFNATEEPPAPAPVASPKVLASTVTVVSPTLKPVLPTLKPPIAAVVVSTPSATPHVPVVVTPSTPVPAAMPVVIPPPVSAPMEPPQPQTQPTPPAPKLSHSVAKPMPKPTPKPAAPPVAPPAAKPVPVAPAATAPPPAMEGSPDLSSTVLETYAGKMGCESPDANAQTKMVCGYLQEFASGLPVELPLKPGMLFMGPEYTIDSYGRFTDLRHDVLMGNHSPSTATFIPLKAAGGQEDFEIRTLLEAQKAKTPLPKNTILGKIYSEAPQKRYRLATTTGRSVVIRPETDRRFFIRRAQDHWVLIGVSGDTAEIQKRSSLSVAVLY